MDHTWMNAITALLVERRVSVARFEFSFMASVREGGKRRPAPRGEKLVPEYMAAARSIGEVVADDLPLFIGGKSLGGRVASLVAAAELFAAGQISGVVCFGYPFHPPKKPEKLRTSHLAQFDCPMLIVQGTRDALGSKAEIEGYALDERIRITWCEDGDHDLKPRKSSGETLDGHLAKAADAVRTFVEAAIAPGSPTFADCRAR
jgi:hypothetical protein